MHITGMSRSFVLIPFGLLSRQYPLPTGINLADGNRHSLILF